MIKLSTKSRAILFPITCASLATLSAFRLATATKLPQTRNMHIKPYVPTHNSWPYSQRDFTRQDESPDDGFYSAPRFVTHIDDSAITRLRDYYDAELPKKGRILDFCSSWISHYPTWADKAVRDGDLVVLGAGMNKAELEGNELLADHQDRQILQDLNTDPDVAAKLGSELLDAATCTVSIDYLTKPREVLQSIRSKTREGARIHLAISNRCFSTKVIGRWLRVGEEQRLEMVGDYLHFSGWSNIEIVELPAGQAQAPSEGRTTLQSILGFFGKDPLYVVRAVNQQKERSEL